MIYFFLSGTVTSNNVNFSSCELNLINVNISYHFILAQKWGIRTLIYIHIYMNQNLYPYLYILLISNHYALSEIGYPKSSYQLIAYIGLRHKQKRDCVSIWFTRRHKYKQERFVRWSRKPPMTFLICRRKLYLTSMVLKKF